jgi:hypothetical protein
VVSKRDKKRPAKSGVLTLRIPPELHEDLVVAAVGLGLDVTGLIRLMIRRSLPHFQLEARLIALQAEEALHLLDKWRRDNPGRPIREFWGDYYRHQKTVWVKDLTGIAFSPQMGLDEAFGGIDLEQVAREIKTRLEAGSGESGSHTRERAR